MTAALSGLPALPGWYLPTLLAVTGPIFGSFLAVVAARVPAGQDLLTPSHCTGCDRPLRWWENVPVLAYLALRGRCRTCKALIPPSVLAFELAGAALFAVGAFAVPGQSLPLYLALVIGGLPLAAVDLREHRLPDVLVVLLSVLVLTAVMLTAAIQADPLIVARAVLGGLAYSLCLLAIALIKAGGMGLGDIKLALPLGAAVAAGAGSYPAVALTFFGSYLIGLLLVPVLLLTRGVRDHGKGPSIAMGPAMLASAVLCVVAGEPLIDFYLGLAGLF